jgi:riboflavin kinase/FMN adenylyltransferase
MFTISGRVQEGKKLGRTIGFPTANISVANPPNNGVYGVKVYYHANVYYGVMNVGIRPTFENGSTVSCEIHLLDFTGDLYGAEINVDICFFIRQEKKFANIVELASQINRDIDTANKTFLNREAEAWMR